MHCLYNMPLICYTGFTMINKIVLLTLWFILVPSSFASLYYATNWNIIYGLIIGASLAIFPLVVLSFNKKLFMPRLLESIIVLATIIISITVAYKIALPLINKNFIELEQLLPLLATTLALYAFYILLNRISPSRVSSHMNLTNRVESILSGPPMLLTLGVSIIVSTCVLIAAYTLGTQDSELVFFTAKLLDRGIIPPLTVMLFFWGVLILIGKAYVLWSENRLFPDANKSLLLQAYKETTLASNNATTDIYIDLLWRKSSDFYILPRYINWSIPILGFTGTVFGISLAAEGIQKIISSEQGLTQTSSELSVAIAPLGIAFDTTLIALSLSIVLTLMQTILQRWENAILTNYENCILEYDE